MTVLYTYPDPSLVLVQSRKTHLYITERLLMECKESNQTNEYTYLCFNDVCCIGSALYVESI